VSARFAWAVEAAALGGPRARERLDRFVVRRLQADGARATRADVQRAIDEGRVLVDGAASRSAAVVKPGARVEYVAAPPPPSRATPDASVELRVIFEDAHLLVIDKPAGLVVHPSRGHAQGTLVNGLLARPSFARARATATEAPGHDGEHGEHDDPIARDRPGIVHRLDKGTSGLLVVAKDGATREGLKALFQTHDIEREYVALVEGAVSATTFDTLHGRHATDRLKFTTRVRSGKRAVTHVRPLERLGAASLVACTLETGRTHQIRVHLAECAKAPIVGDPLYGRAPRDPRLAELARSLDHQALHARVLGFVHPRTGRAMRWESPLPIDLARLVEALRVTKSAT